MISVNVRLDNSHFSVSWSPFKQEVEIQVKINDDIKTVSKYRYTFLIYRVGEDIGMDFE